jgi:hypothetical protein
MSQLDVRDRNGDGAEIGPITEPVHPVGGPVSKAWREGTLTRAKELESLYAWVTANDPGENSRAITQAIPCHLDAARDAAQYMRPRFWKSSKKSSHRTSSNQRLSNGSLIERAMSNLDAAEALLLNVAPPDYLLGQMPGLLNHVQRHLIAKDPRRQELERIAQRIGVKDPNHPPASQGKERTLAEKAQTINEERGKVVTAVRGASSAALREQLRVRSFSAVLIVTIVAMTLLAAIVALVGFINPTMIPLCFAPEEGGQARIVCPTAHSPPLTAEAQAGPELDNAVRQTAKRGDLFLVEIVGLAAAAVAAATAIREIRGSSERSGIPIALAVLKLPMGALTAFLGLLLMRGQFVPGLSALDTSAQILAWALVFGFAQQLFTRLVDQQGHTVLDSVRGADKQHEPGPTPP